MDDAFYNQVGGDRIGSRQIDELIGIARGLIADGRIAQSEVEFLEKWLASNRHITNQPVIDTLYQRIREILADGIVDQDEKNELLDTLNDLARGDFEIGETLKATTLPLCDPAPDMTFAGMNYCFTGTFVFGSRRDCQDAVTKRGGSVGNVTRKTDYLVIGTYVTDSWLHSSYGTKIMKASEYRDRRGLPISIVSEEHWASYL